MRFRLGSHLPAAALALFLLPGCPPPEPAELPKPPLTPAVANKPPPEPELPAEGLLDQWMIGGRTLVRVEHKGGFRVLSIDGVVLAAVPIGDVAKVPSGDPMVALVRAARPPRAGEKTPVLVLGLGSGRTARELAKAGYDVEVVERESVLIDLARKYFSFDGNVSEGDPAARLEHVDFDKTIVVVDSWVGVPMPKEAHKVLSGKGRKGILLAVRDKGKPFEDRIRRTLGGIATGAFTERFGSGVADEEQNLYLLVSGSRGFNFVPPAGGGLGLWRIPDRSEDMPARVGEGRSIRLTGYLLRTEDGKLAVDLPHHEKGAMRYLLRGDTSALEKLLPADALFPTDGGIASDGDSSKTVRDLLGGGGVKQSEVRYSPVLVDLQGEARLVAVVHPSTASSVPAAERGDAPTHPTLPHGGALYELQIEKVIRTTDKGQWDALQKQLEKPWKASLSGARSGKLLDAATAIETYVQAMDAFFLDTAPRLVRRRYMAEVFEAATIGYLQAESSVAVARGGQIGSACHTAWEVHLYTKEYEPIQPLRDAFLECADTFLTRAILSGPVDFRAELGLQMRDVLQGRYEGDKRIRKWKTMSNWVPPPE